MYIASDGIKVITVITGEEVDCTIPASIFITIATTAEDIISASIRE